jgi:hypothetical protein
MESDTGSEVAQRWDAPVETHSTQCHTGLSSIKLELDTLSNSDCSNPFSYTRVRFTPVSRLQLTRAHAYSCLIPY